MIDRILNFSITLALFGVVIFLGIDFGFDKVAVVLLSFVVVGIVNLSIAVSHIHSHIVKQQIEKGLSGLSESLKEVLEKKPTVECEFCDKPATGQLAITIKDGTKIDNVVCDMHRSVLEKEAAKAKKSK